MIYLLFTCAVIIGAGFLLASYVSIDDFEGHWRSIGVMEDDRLSAFGGGPAGHELFFEDGRVIFSIGGEPMNAVYSRRKIRVELTAQICMEYKLSLQEGRLILTDPGGMQMVFERIDEERDGRRE